MTAYAASQVPVGIGGTLSTELKAGVVQNTRNWEALRFTDNLLHGSSDYIPPHHLTGTGYWRRHPACDKREHI